MTQEVTTPAPVQIRVLEELKKDNSLPALVAAVESVKAPESVKEEVALQFTDFFERIERYTTPAFALVVADETEKEKMFDAAQAITALKGLEKSLTAKHGELKEDALRYGQTLDATKRAALALIMPAVEHLKAQAEFIERKEAARVEALRVERYNLILPYLVPEILPTPYPMWGEMHEDDFQATLHAAKEKARQIEAERVARIEKERADAAELERLRIENERQARELAEAKRINAQQTIQRVQAVLDPPVNDPEPATQTDREKLRAYIIKIMAVPAPELEDEAMKHVFSNVIILLHKIDNFVKEKTA